MSNLLDREAMMEHFGGDSDLIKTVAEQFLSSYEEMLSNIEVAIKSGVAKDLEHSGHTLKGASSYFYCESVVELAKKLEYMGREGNIEGSQGIFEELKENTIKLAQELKQF